MKKLKKCLSLIMAVAIFFSLSVPNAFAASSETHWAVGATAVTGNPSNKKMPATLTSANGGDTVYVNFQTTEKVTQIVFKAIDPGSSTTKTLETVKFNNYGRYANTKYTLPNVSGTFKATVSVTYTNGTKKTYTCPYVTVTKKSTSVSSKIAAFTSDSRWKNGVSWGASQKPKLSSYSSSGCCAYAADFAKYVYNKSGPRAGTKYTSASSIKTGDIIYVTPQHWMCILSRSGNTLKVAEGNCSSKVRITSYTLSGSKILNSSGKTYKTFSYGYHF